METNKKYFAFYNDVKLVSGAKRGLIYDLTNKKIFSINKTSKDYLLKLLTGSSIEEVFFYFSQIEKNKFCNFLELLVQNNLGYYSKKKVTSDTFYQKNIEKILDTVWFELRKACNLKCCHCYLDANNNRDKDLDILTLSDWYKVVDQLKMYQPKKIILIGGEPLMFKEICELIQYISKILYNTQIVLYSNLTMINDHIVSVIQENNVKVVTSIYANEARIHDKITGIPGSFQKTIAAISKIKRAKISIKANTVLMKYNENIINDTLDFVYYLTGIKGKVDIIRNVGKSKKYLLPTIKIGKYKSQRNRANFSGIDKETFIKNISGNSCFQRKINICCDGTVTPCIMENNFVNNDYNIKKHSIKCIIEQYILPNYWRVSKDYIEVCKDCEYRYLCKDCRPINESVNNMYLRGDCCTYNPYTGKW